MEDVKDIVETSVSMSIEACLHEQVETGFLLGGDMAWRLVIRFVQDMKQWKKIGDREMYEIGRMVLRLLRQYVSQDALDKASARFEWYMAGLGIRAIEHVVRYRCRDEGVIGDGGVANGGHTPPAAAPVDTQAVGTEQHTIGLSSHEDDILIEEIFENIMIREMESLPGSSEACGAFAGALVNALCGVARDVSVGDCYSACCWRLGARVMASLSIVKVRCNSSGIVGYDGIRDVTAMALTSAFLTRGFAVYHQLQRNSVTIHGNDRIQKQGALETYLALAYGEVMTSITEYFLTCSKERVKELELPYTLMREIVFSMGAHASAACDHVLDLIWATCRKLASQEPADAKRGLALGILVQYSDFMLAREISSFIEDQELWELLKWSMESSRSVLRKRGMHILGGVIESMPAHEASIWKTFLQLYTALDDTSMHLFKEHWDTMKVLHPVERVEAPLPFPWIMLLWRHALLHRQITAQKLACMDFLSRSWSNSDLERIPLSFMSDVIIPCFGQNGTNKGQYATEIHDAIPGFFSRWVEALQGQDEKVCDLIRPLIDAISRPKQQYTSMMFCAYSLEAIAAASVSRLNSPVMADMIIAAASAQHVFGANYVGIQCHKALMQVASKFMSLKDEEGLGKILQWIKTVPKGLIQPGCTLYEHAVASFRVIVGHSGPIERQIDVIRRRLDLVCHAEFRQKDMWNTSAALVRTLMVLGQVDQKMMDECLIPWKQQMIESIESMPYGAYHMLYDILDMGIHLEGKQVAPPTALSLAVLEDFGDTVLSILYNRVLILQDKVETYMNPDYINAMASDCMESNPNLTGRETNLDPWLPTDFVECREFGMLDLVCIMCFLKLHKKAQTGLIPLETLHKIQNVLTTLTGTIAKHMGCTKLLDLQLEDESASSLILRKVDIEMYLLALRLASAALKTQEEVNAEVELATSEETNASVLHIIEIIISQLKLIYIGAHTEIASHKAGESKKSKKPGPLNLEQWKVLMSWRTLDAAFERLYATSGDLSSICVETKSKILAFAVAACATSTDGSPIILPAVHCLKKTLPCMFEDWDSITDGLKEAFQYTGIEIGDFWSPSVALDIVGMNLTELIEGQTRKKSGISAAILTTCVHPYLFSLGDKSDAATKIIEQIHSDGSVEKILNMIIAAGKRFTRLLIHLSCHVCGLFSINPKIGAKYSSLLVEICLSGYSDKGYCLAQAKDEILDPVTAEELTKLEPPVHPDVISAHAQTEVAPRVAVLCLLYHWVQEGLAGCQVSLEAAQTVWDALFKLAVTDEVLAAPKYAFNGPIHRSKIRLWQALAILCPSVRDSDTESVCQTTVRLLEDHNAVNVKQYQEVVIVAQLIRCPHLIMSVIVPALKNYEIQRREFVPSLSASLCSAVTHLDEEHSFGEDCADFWKRSVPRSEWKELVLATVDAVVPWVASFPHAHRTFSQLVIWRMVELYPWLIDTHPLLKSLYNFFSHNSDLLRLRQALQVDTGLDKFNITKACSPEGILCSNVTVIGTSSDDLALEHAPVSLLGALESYLQEQRAELRIRLEEHMKSLEGGNELRAKQQLLEDESRVDSDKLFWQRKITPMDHQSAALEPWREALGSKSLLSSTATSADAFQHDSYEVACNISSNLQADAIKRQDIIVVASLIDKVPNLAGITRTCEIFRARKLLVPDASVTSDPTFASISVSAENWVDIKELKPTSLFSWLQQMATSGYKLVGLEQTEDSSNLPDYQFEDKTVLILGAEKYGIPANVLQILNDTVEIPQLGVVRSLNVHVSAAITLYEYTRQRHFQFQSR